MNEGNENHQKCEKGNGKNTITLNENLSFSFFFLQFFATIIMSIPSISFLNFPSFKIPLSIFL